MYIYICKKEKNKKAILPETTPFHCGRCFLRPFEASSFCITKSKRRTYTPLLKKIPLLRIIIWHSQVYLVSHQVLENPRFHLPMDFISDMATMLKFLFTQKYFCDSHDYYYYLCWNFKILYARNWKNVSDKIINRSNYLAEQWWENSHSLWVCNCCYSMCNSHWVRVAFHNACGVVSLNDNLKLLLGCFLIDTLSLEFILLSFW